MGASILMGGGSKNHRMGGASPLTMGNPGCYQNPQEGRHIVLSLLASTKGIRLKRKPRFPIPDHFIIRCTFACSLNIMYSKSFHMC